MTSITGRLERRPAAHTYFSMTRSLCGACGRAVDGKTVFRDDAVWLEKFCPAHGRERALVANSVEWYLDCLTFLAPARPPARFARPVERGCPFDCGACPSHQQSTYQALLPSQTEKSGNLGPALARLAREQPTLGAVHVVAGAAGSADLPADLRACQEAGFAQAALVADAETLRGTADALGALNLRAVLTGPPEAALGVLGHAGVATTLRPTLSAEPTDAELLGSFSLLTDHAEVRALELSIPPARASSPTPARLTVPDLHRALARVTGGRLHPKAFVPSPLAHVHCVSTCPVLILDGGGYLALADLVGRAAVFALLQAGWEIEADARLEAALREALRVGPAPARPTLERLLAEAFPAEDPPSPAARRLVDARVKRLTIHALMGAPDFDVARVMRCPVAWVAEDGAHTPLCAEGWSDPEPRAGAPRTTEPLG